MQRPLGCLLPCCTRCWKCCEAQMHWNAKCKRQKAEQYCFRDFSSSWSKLGCFENLYIFLELDLVMFSSCWWVCISYRGMWKAPILGIAHLLLVRINLHLRVHTNLHSSTSSCSRRASSIASIFTSFQGFLVYISENQTKKDLQKEVSYFQSFGDTCPPTAVVSYLFTLNPHLLSTQQFKPDLTLYIKVDFERFICPLNNPTVQSLKLMNDKTDLQIYQSCVGLFGYLCAKSNTDRDQNL